MKTAGSMQPAMAASPPANPDHRQRVLIVDLNNFASFPTLAVGILIAALRSAGFEVKLISPLAHDVPASERERAETRFHDFQRRVHLSTRRSLRPARDAVRQVRHWWQSRPHPRVLEEVKRALNARPDAILLSAYLQHHATVSEIGKVAHRAGIPLLLGGPAFTSSDAAEHWRAVPGLHALIAAEVDLNLPQIVSALCNGGDLLQFDGVTLPDGHRSAPAKPLAKLDALPVPDFTDFPWDRYRVRIVPLMASRGCQWNRCNFCSDIVSTSGRSFRTRSVEAVMHEMRVQSRRYSTSDFLFLDLKLNSNPGLLRGIVEEVQRNVPGAQWIGTVHVDQRKDNGLSRAELRAAVAAGMRRISFGLESGSQALLDAMDKGCSVEANSEFLRNAHEAGLSVRCTMFKGYPGETAHDLELTAEFLERHSGFIDRIRFNDFSIPAGTPILREVQENPARFPHIKIAAISGEHARAHYSNSEGHGRSYRRAKNRVLGLVHEINRRKIRPSARVFDGLM